METWYIEGMTGNKPVMPFPGYSWKEIPQLNDKFYNDYKNESFDIVYENLGKSHTRMQNLIEKHSDEDLFTKKRYSWTGSTPIGCYFISATSSHYNWAINLIKKWLKSN
jgi:hypothetical protein